MDRQLSYVVWIGMIYNIPETLHAMSLCYVAELVDWMLE